MKNIIFLPIEIKTREFDAKLLLALQIANDGNKAIVCTRGYCNDLRNKPNGVVLAKSIAGFELDTIIKHKEHGNMYTSLDIEGILNISYKDQSFRFSQDTINQVDKVFINGINELERIRKNDFLIEESKISITGAPQFDFYKKPLSNVFKDKSDLYKSKYGKYILVLSRFGESNNKYKNDEQSWEEFYNETLDLNMSKELINLYDNFEKYSTKIFKNFLSMIPYLAKEFSEYRIIIRPHPNEKLNTWEDVTNKLDNVKVVFEGAVGPWIQGSDFVIHNGCTTAIESYLLEKPIISYMPYTSKKYDLHIANKTGKQCSSIEEVVSSGKDILNGKYKKQNIDDELKKYIYNIDLNAYEILSCELSKLSCKIQKTKSGKLEKNIFRKEWKKTKLKFKKGNSNKKFPYTSLGEVKNKVENMCIDLGIDSKRIKIKEVDYNSFLIYKK